MSNKIQPDTAIHIHKGFSIVQPGTQIPHCTKCGHLSCVCNFIENHKPECRLRVAATCPIPISCQHGRDVCPECDACDCGAL